jgi:hypothetical protein
VEAEGIAGRALEVLARRAGGTEAERVFAQVLLAGARAQAAAVAVLLDTLGDLERFLALMAVGLLFPTAVGAAAFAANESLPRSDLFRWVNVCDSKLAAAWAIAVSEQVDAELVGAILARDPYGTAALTAAVAHRAERGELDAARVLYRAIASFAKADKSLARAHIALCAKSRALGVAAVESELNAAIDDVAADPIIQCGGDEVAALAELLARMIQSRVVEPQHGSVRLLQARLHALRTVKPNEKDRKSWGYRHAAYYAADAATAEQPGWLTVAEGIAQDVWQDELAAEVKARLEAAQARILGVPVASAPPDATQPEPRPSLEELAREARLDVRARSATRLAAVSWAQGDRAATEAALRLAFAAPLLQLSEPGKLAFGATFAAALVGAGREQAGLERLLGLSQRWRASQFYGREQQSMLDAVSSLLLPGASAAPSEARGQAARELLLGLLPGSFLTQFAAAAGAGAEKFNFVAPLFARVARSLNEPQLELDVLRAAALVQEHELKPGNLGARRVTRIEQTLLALAQGRSASELEPQLAAWRAALGPTPELMAALAPLFQAWTDAEMAERLGPVPDRLVPALALAWTRAGRFEEALTRVSTCKPQFRAEALCAMADAGLDAKLAAKLVRAYEKCPKRGRERDEQTMWKHGRALLRLRLGMFEEAFAELATLPDCVYIGWGPGPLALQIVDQLDRAEQWSPLIATAFVDALASRNVPARTLLCVIGATGPRAPVSGNALDQLQTRYPGADFAVVEVALAGGLTRAGDVLGAARTLEAALQRFEKGRSRLLRPPQLIECARWIADAGGDARMLLQRAHSLFTAPDRYSVEELGSVIAELRPSELPILRASLDRLPDILIQAGHAALAPVLANRLVQQPLALEMLLESIEAGPSLNLAQERAGWLAVACARLGEHACAERLAAAIDS